MALLFMDGFDHYGHGVRIDPLKWGTQVGSGIMQAVATGAPVRTGTGSLSGYYANDKVITYPLPASGGFVIGLAIRFTVAPGGSGGIDFLEVREGTTIHMVLSITPAAVLQVKRGTTVLATGTQTLPQSSWNYVEFKGVIHATTGSYEVRLDGVSDVALTASGIPTRNGGATGQWDRIGVGVPVDSSFSSNADDVYVCDLSGSAPQNDFLGPVKITTLMAVPGNGSNVGFTPSTGTDHGALVDEIPGNTTDFNSGNAVGLKDTYNIANLTVTGDILGIQTCMYTAKSDAGTRQVCAVVRTGGTDYDGGNKPLLTTFSYATQIFQQKPGVTPADWTVADVNALEAGLKITL